VREKCLNGRCGGSITTGQDVVDAANLIKTANDGDKFSWLFPHDYFNSWGKKQVIDKAAATIPYFAQVFNVPTNGSCGC